MALIKAVRREQAQTAVMVLAAYDTPGLRHQMKALSIRHYQVKPIMVSDLAAAVRVAVQGAQCLGICHLRRGSRAEKAIKAALYALCRAATVGYRVDTHAPARAIVVIGSTTNPFTGKGARHGYRRS